MQIVYTTTPGKGDMDLLLRGFARAMQARGLRLCGTVQINSEGCAGHRCDMDVEVLPAGPVIRISQDLGASARGCRLDPAALEQAVGLCMAQLQAGADLVMINKFGKHEADGRGFRPLIAEALSRDIPVVVGLNGANLAAFQTFTEGCAQEIAPDQAALIAWADLVFERA